MFAEIWTQVGPTVASVLAGQGAAEVQDQRLSPDRGAGARNAWFSFSYNPIPLADGSIGGILNVAAETTERVLSEQRRDEVEGALRDSEELRGIARVRGGRGAWRWDPRSGLVRADDAFQDLWAWRSPGGRTRPRCTRT